jgi:hypothetical protein
MDTWKLIPYKYFRQFGKNWLLADDTTLFCNSKEDVQKAMNEIEIFGSFSGLLLNRNKTEGVWIGKLKNSK